MSNQPLAGRTLLMSGGSRGIGLAIAVRAAALGANIAFIAKTDDPDPRIPGTVHTAKEEIEKAGARALAVVGDIRDDETVDRAVDRTLKEFGGIDFVVNNASAIALQGFGDLQPKRYDLMLDINARGTFSLVTAALPALLESDDARVVTLSPPINLDPRWLAEHAPYTVSKYAMTLLTLGVAEQFRDRGIVANCLWPETLIATAAVQNVVAGDAGIRGSRRPEIMADAAAILLTRPQNEGTGECLIDADVLRRAGVADLTGYIHDGADETGLVKDLFL